MDTILNGEDGLNRRGSPKSAVKKAEVAGPLRVLVITTTHLVPGGSFREKIKFLTTEVCHNVLGRDFNKLTDRRTTKDCTFGYSGRKCFFMLDYIGDENVDGHPDFKTLMEAGNTPKKVRLNIKVRDLEDFARMKLRQEIEEIKSRLSGGSNASRHAAADESYHWQPKKKLPVVKIPMLQYRWDGANLVQDDATTLKIYRVLSRSFPFPIPEDNPKNCLKKFEHRLNDPPARIIWSQRRALLQRLECMSMPSRKNLARFSKVTADRGDMEWLEQRLGEHGTEGQRIYRRFVEQVKRADRMEERKARARGQVRS